jgi:ribonuclease Z
MLMPSARTVSEITLVNGSTGDPALFIDYPGRDNALLFDAGEVGSLGMERLGDLEGVFITHHHVDHFIGLDRIVRANLDRDKTLHIYGPTGTIRKVYDRIKSYEYQYFPFQKIVLDVHDLLPGVRRSARLECSRRFPEPDVVETRWDGPEIHANDDLSVEATHVDHTVPCLAFALVEKPGFHPDAARLAGGALRGGPWVATTLELLRQRADPETPISIEGGQFTLGWLGERYFQRSRGSRLAYVTDTMWSDLARPGLLRLARRAKRLYCDSYYARAQAARAQTHRHMTASQAAEFAAEAKVDELVLIHFAPRYKGSYEELVAEAREIFPKTSAEFD